MAQLVLILVLNLFFNVFAMSAPAERPTPSGLDRKSLNVCVYFDRLASVPNYKLGDIYAIMTKNLLGHFVEVRTDLRVAADYRAGDLNNCHRAIYIGSYYEAPLPEAFLLDVAAFERPFFWMNYNIWRLQKLMGAEVFAKRFGFNFDVLQQFTDVPSEHNTDPGFYRNFHYKGELFKKLSLYRGDIRKVITSPEIAILKVKDAEILAEAEHNKTMHKTAYVVRKDKFFYIADIPYSFIHEADRYLIVTDILFDVLGLPPRHKKRYAIARIEDIHPEYEMDLMYNTIGTIRKHKIPFAISVIPNFVDPFGYRAGHPESSPMARKPKFLKMLRYAQANGASMILHGVTHQVDRMNNCDTGSSGDDFEFWDGCRSAPLPFADETWIRNRLARGLREMKTAGFTPTAWIPPHYEASQLAYTIFGEIFPRSIQRVRYMPYDVDANTDKINWAGQFFPYTIYEDYYGQFVWPENLGNVRVPGYKADPAKIREHDHNLRYPEEMVESAKRNLVIRDSWASFFWHPQLISHEVGIKSLDTIITEIKKNGYEFISLKDNQDTDL
jgi:uncharacterized protein YdaL